MRTKHLSSLIDPQAKSVMDLGCGEMKLREYLAPEIKYIPVDYVKRSEETLVCDFNKHQFSHKNGRHCVLQWSLRIYRKYVGVCLETL